MSEAVSFFGSLPQSWTGLARCYLVLARVWVPWIQQQRYWHPLLSVGRIAQWRRMDPPPCHALPVYSTAMVPFINAAWPGKLQKNSYRPPASNLLTGKLNEVVSPPPIILLCAMTRSSPGLT